MSMVLTERLFRVAWSDIYPARVDWSQILHDLELAGWNANRIATLFGTPRSTVVNWKHGHEPRHSAGAALLVLHAHFCSPEATKKRQTEARSAP